MTETRAGRTSPPGAWLDEGEVSPEWAPPTGAPGRGSRTRRILAYAGVPLVLALVLGLVHATGGFGRRTDLLTPVAPGTPISTGPYELTFTEATARPQPSTGAAAADWEVVVIGSARTTRDEAMAPSAFGADSMFALRDPAGDATANPSGVDIGDLVDGRSSGRTALTPGLPATAYQVRFTLPAGFRPGATVRLGVAELVYDARYLTTDEESWHNGTYGSSVDLPLRVIPPG